MLQNIMTSVSSSLGLLSGYESSGSDPENERTPSVSASAVKSPPHSTSSSDEEMQESDRTGSYSSPLSTPKSSSRLPAPLLGHLANTSSGGVFCNPFREEQQAQQCILEQHVKLSDSNWAKRGRGACLAYQRDGRCRYGTKCKYSHDSDLPQGTAEGEQRESPNSDSQAKDERPQQEAEGLVKVCKRKKPGASNTLIPPKKSLKNYQKQLSAERPWTL